MGAWTGSFMLLFSLEGAGGGLLGGLGAGMVGVGGITRGLNNALLSNGWKHCTTPQVNIIRLVYKPSSLLVVYD